MQNNGTPWKPYKSTPTVKKELLEKVRNKFNDMQRYVVNI